MYTVLRSPASRLYLDALPKALAFGYASLPLLPAKRTPFQKGWADFYCEGDDLPSAEDILAFCDVSSLPYSRKESGEQPWAVGYATRRLADGTFLCFLDVDDPKEIAALESLTGLSADNTTTKVGSKGQTYFFRLRLASGGEYNERSYNCRVRGIVDLLTWHAQTAVPPSLNHKTLKPYRWGQMGLLKADELPIITEDKLAAVLARYGRKPRLIKAQQEVKRDAWAKLPDIEIEQLPEAHAKEGWRMVDTLIAAMQITGSAKLAARNRNGFVWELDIANTRQWHWLLGAFVDWFGSPGAAEPFLDKLSKGDYLPDGERARVREAYNRFRNWSKLQGIHTAAEYQLRESRKARSIKTLHALKRAASAIVNHHKLGEARKAAHVIAAGKLSLDELAEATANAIAAKTRSGNTRELALLLLEGVATNGGEHRIGADLRTQLREQLGVGANDLAQLLQRLRERGLFIVKGGSGGNRVTTVGFNVELVADVEHQPRLSDAELTQLTREEEKQAGEAIAAMAKAEPVSDLPLLLAEFDGIMPPEVVEVLREPDFDGRTRRHVANQTKGLAIELSYLVNRVQRPESLRLLKGEKFAYLLEEEDGGVTTATVAHRVLEEAFLGFMSYLEWWAEKCAKESKPAHLPPSRIIGIYRNQLAIAMKDMNMGTRRYLTARFWPRVRRGEVWVGKRPSGGKPPSEQVSNKMQAHHTTAHGTPGYV
jgi:hypothetical protein